MDNEIQSNKTPSLGIHINREKDMGHLPVPQWAKSGDRMA